MKLSIEAPANITQIKLPYKGSASSKEPYAGRVDLTAFTNLQTFIDDNRSGVYKIDGFSTHPRLETFRVLYSNLSGPVPAMPSNTYFKYLKIDYGHALSGPMPAVLPNQTTFEHFQISNSHNSVLTGPLPSNIANCSSLKGFIITGNGNNLSNVVTAKVNRPGTPPFAHTVYPIDSRSGNVKVGMTVTSGSSPAVVNGISGSVTVSSVAADQSTVTLSSSQTLGNNVTLTFTEANYLPASLPTTLETFYITNTSSTGSHRGTIPTITSNTALRVLELRGVELIGDLPTSLSANTALTHFRIGAKSSKGTAHKDVTASSSFPDFSSNANLKEVAITNIRAGSGTPRITSVANNVFGSSNTALEKVIVDYNNLETANVDNLLTALVATNRSNGNLYIRTNKKPTGLTSMSATDTGNASVNTLKSRGWTFFTSAGTGDYQWPS